MEVSVVGTDSGLMVAPARSLKVPPPLVETCHCTVGAGLPEAAALKEALAPAVTVWLAG